MTAKEVVQQFYELSEAGKGAETFQLLDDDCVLTVGDEQTAAGTGNVKQ